MEESGRINSAEPSAQAAHEEETEMAQGPIASPSQDFGTASCSVSLFLSATFPFLGHSHLESSMDPSALQPPSLALCLCRMSTPPHTFEYLKKIFSFFIVS